MLRPSSSEVACPYIGLKPFSEKERFLFFGREADAERLVNKILSSGDAVHGPSGVGKSSLLIARVAPDLRVQPDWPLRRPCV